MPKLRILEVVAKLFFSLPIFAEVLTKTQMWFNLFFRHRKSLGISLFLFGGPIMYFLRDGIGIAPGSIVFTALFQGFCFILMFPNSIKGLRNLNKPNLNAYYYSYWFMALGFAYMLVYRGEYTNFSTTIIYDVFVFTFFFLLLTVSFRDIIDDFVWITLLVALIGCILMVFYVFRNPNFVLGQRATIAFTGLDKDNDYNQAGNPHIYSKVAVAGFWAGIVLRNHRKIMVRLTAQFTVLVTTITLILTQVMASYLAILIGFLFYAYYDKSVGKNIRNWIFGWKGIIFAIISVSAGLYIYFFTKLGKAIDLYSTFIFSRFEKIINLVIGGPKNYIDESAKGRTDGFEKMLTGLTESLDGEFWYFIFGRGYEVAYLDMPFFQTFHDMGIIGFLLYFMVLWAFLKGARQAIKYQESKLTVFIALYFFMTFVYAFTQGMPYGYYAWYFYALYARFLGTNTLIKIMNYEI